MWLRLWYYRLAVVRTPSMRYRNCCGGFERLTVCLAGNSDYVVDFVVL